MPAPVKQPDESQSALVQRVREGDHSAFYELVRPHERGLYLSALSIVRNEADAEEVAQRHLDAGRVLAVPEHPQHGLPQDQPYGRDARAYALGALARET